jgi:hypothetical protein
MHLSHLFGWQPCALCGRRLRPQATFLGVGHKKADKRGKHGGSAEGVERLHGILVHERGLSSEFEVLIRCQKPRFALGGTDVHISRGAYVLGTGCYGNGGGRCWS